MEQIYMLFYSIALFNLHSLSFNVISSSKMNNFTTVQRCHKILKANKMFFKEQGHNHF